MNFTPEEQERIRIRLETYLSHEDHKYLLDNLKAIFSVEYGVDGSSTLWMTESLLYNYTFKGSAK